jgi:hypothetical protein
MSEIKVRDGGTLSKGETFDFKNEHETDCEVSQCSPPLVDSSYEVKAGSTKQAKVQSDVATGTYEYVVDCGGKKKRDNPKIIIQSK